MGGIPHDVFRVAVLPHPVVDRLHRLHAKMPARKPSEARQYCCIHATARFGCTGLLFRQAASHQRFTRAKPRPTLGMPCALWRSSSEEILRSGHSKRVIQSERPLLSSDSIPRALPTIAWTKLPDGAVLFSPESEVYYAMNQVGALIWELLDERDLDMDSLCLAVREHFPDGTIDQIRDDVAELLKQLEQNGLVAAVRHSSAA